MPKNDQPWLGIDLGGTNIQAGVMVGDGKLLARDSTKTKAEEGSDQVISRIEKVVGKVLDAAKLKPADVAGLGIGAPGAIDVDKGVVIKAVNLGWADFPLGKALSKKLDLPVLVDNDVNVGTWGAYRAGAAKDYQDVLGIFIGTGIGGGLILDGKLYHGHHMSAGEIGHTVVCADAPLGRRTLENLASRTSIANQIAALIRSSHQSVISELTDGDLSKIRSKVLAKAFEQDDPLTVEIVTEAARVIGIAIANTVTLLSLEAAVLGGGVTEALGKPFAKLVEKSFRQHVFPPDLADCPIVASTLGDDAGVIGAAWLARDELGGS